MMRVNVSFDDETYEVGAHEDAFDAERLDFNATLADAETLRQQEKPLADPIDWPNVTVSFQRVNTDDTGLGEKLNKQAERDAKREERESKRAEAKQEPNATDPPSNKR